MYTYVVPNAIYPEDYSKAVILYQVKTIEEAYAAFTNSPFFCKILDFNGDEMNKEEMQNRLAGKTHVVKLYFEAFRNTCSYEDRHVWFKTNHNVDLFSVIRIVGKDNIVYDGVVVDEAYVKELPARMGKTTI